MVPVKQEAIFGRLRGFIAEIWVSLVFRKDGLTCRSSPGRFSPWLHF